MPDMTNSFPCLVLISLVMGNVVLFGRACPDGAGADRGACEGQHDHACKERAVAWRQYAARIFFHEIGEGGQRPQEKVHVLPYAEPGGDRDCPVHIFVFYGMQVADQGVSIWASTPEKYNIALPIGVVVSNFSLILMKDVPFPENPNGPAKATV